MNADSLSEIQKTRFPCPQLFQIAGSACRSVWVGAVPGGIMG